MRTAGLAGPLTRVSKLLPLQPAIEGAIKQSRLVRMLLLPVPMTPLPAPPAFVGSLIRWQFEKGPRALTCGVAEDGQGAFDVVISEPASDAAVERYDGAADALLRHAFIASALRADGWTLTHHSR